MIRNQARLLARLRAIHAAIRDTVVAACERTAIEQLAEVVADEAGDTIFAIDRVSEATLLQHFGDLARDWSFTLTAEGLGESGQLTLPTSFEPERAELQIIVDPIDGTRGLMYQKRSAWILTGVAPNRGPDTTLADIELAIMTEIPLLKQHLCDTLWASSAGVGGERLNRLNGNTQPLSLRPSRATTIAQGYGGISRFFPGPRAELAAIDEAVVARVLGPAPAGRALAFEDQYISTGGQLYELIMGHDRWIADLRPLVDPLLISRGHAPGLCAHPYDLCTELVARAAGVVVTDERGARLAAPLDVTSNAAWVGYANTAIQAQIEPVLRAVLHEHNLLP